MPRDDANHTQAHGAPSPLVYGPLTHLWQAARWNPALDGGYFGLDERSAADTVRQAIKIAHLLTYFDTDGGVHLPETRPVWPDFLRNDPAFLLARISAHDARHDRRPPTDILYDWYNEARRISITQPGGQVTQGLMTMIETAIKAVNTVSGSAAVTAPDAGDTIPTASHLIQGYGAGRLMAAKGFGRTTGPAGTADPADPADPADTAAVAEATAALHRISQLARARLETSLAADDSHPPQTGLFLAFAQVLQVTRARMNDMTNEHLSFYYRQVLGMSAAAARPDSTWLLLGVAPDQAPFLLPGGSGFFGPEQADGLAPIYETTGAVTLGNARLEQCRALRLPLDRAGVVAGVLGFDAAAFVGPGEGAAAPWPAFGPAQPDAAGRAAAVAAGRTGLVFACDTLAMRDGVRSITLSLDFARDGGRTLSRALSAYRAECGLDQDGGQGEGSERDGIAPVIAAAFDLALSTAKGAVALPASAIAVTLPPRNPDQMLFTLTLPAGFPAVAAQAAAPPDQTGAPDQPARPYISLLFNPDAPHFALSAFGQLQIAHVEISVSAQAVGGVQNGVGGKPLPATPFAPFGPAPVVGDALSFTHPDLAGKRLTGLSLGWQWLGLPAAPDDLASHYAPYGFGTRNSDFRAVFAVQRGGEWVPVAPLGWPVSVKTDGVALFCGPDGAGPDRVGQDGVGQGGAGRNGAGRNGAGKSNRPMQRRADWQFDTGSGGLQPDQPPCLRMTFCAPGYGFANAAYPDILGRAVLANARRKNSMLAKVTGTKPALLPPPPVQARIAGLTLSYRASASMARGEITVLAQVPFDGLVATTRPALAPLPMAGRDMLLLGFSGVKAGDDLPLFMQLHETATATHHPVTASPAARLHWGYRNAKGWQPLPHKAMRHDGTRALTTTGIARLRLPADLARDAAGLVWLALTAPPGTQPLCDFGRIAAGAVRVTRVTDAATAPQGVPVLPAGAIKRPVNRLPALRSVVQPLPSGNGAAAEDERAFYTRLSERLGNRDRAITPRDYETLVLSHFPDVAEAKCVLGAGFTGGATDGGGTDGGGAYGDVRGGNVTGGGGAGVVNIIVAPVAGRSGSGALPVLPLGRREDIAGVLRARAAAWGHRITVSNPVYEPVQLRASVVIRGDIPADEVLNSITTRFAALLCPWRDDPALPMALGCGRVQLADLEADLSALPGVALLTGLSLVQFYRRAGAYGLRDTARPLHHDHHHHHYDHHHHHHTARRGITLRSSAAGAVLVPHKAHELQVIAPDRRIGSMTVARDLYAASPAQVSAWQGGAPVPCAPRPFGIGQMEIGSSLIPLIPADVAPVPTPVPSPVPNPVPNPVTAPDPATSHGHGGTRLAPMVAPALPPAP